MFILTLLSVVTVSVSCFCCDSASVADSITLSDTDDWSQLIPNGCNYFGPLMDRGLAVNGVSFAGEWSLATNDCGLYLNGVNLGTRYEGTYPGTTTSYGSCDQWTNWPAYNDTMKVSTRM
jgi:glucan 1,3-beta-glucosidase